MSIRAFGRFAAVRPSSRRAWVPAQRLFCAGGQTGGQAGGQPGAQSEGQPAGGQAESPGGSQAESPGGSQVPNPLAGTPFEQFGQKAQEVAQAAAQSIGGLDQASAAAQSIGQKAQEAAQSGAQNIGDPRAFAGPILQNLQSSAGPIMQNLQGGAAPLLQNLQDLQGNLQGVAQGQASQLTQQLAPVLTSLLILARTSPGQPLTEEQQAKIAEVLGGGAKEMFNELNEVVPEDPQVTQLRKIADSLANIEAHLCKTGTVEAAAPQAEAATHSNPEAKSE